MFVSLVQRAATLKRRDRVMKYCIKLAIALTLVLAVLPSHGFGSFFTSLAQRQSIDVMREQGGISLDQHFQEPQVITVNGFYYQGHNKKRKGSVWVNGEQLSEKESRSGITIERLNKKDHTARVILNEGAPSHVFKPGQKIYLDRYEMKDAYQ